MNTLNFICILLLTLLLPMSLIGSSGKVLFTDEELAEMGVRIEPADSNGEAAAA